MKMKGTPMRFSTGKIGFLATLGLLVAGAASAITLGFSPSAQTVAPGDSFSIDVVVSDLGGEIVSAYDLDVLYDSSILLSTSVGFGSALGDPAFFEVFNNSVLSTPGLIDFAQLSLLSDASLLVLQGGDSVVLATLSFDVVGAGTSSLDFSFSGSNEIVGSGALNILSVDAESAVVTGIPEPTGAVLFMVGVAVSARYVRRRSQTPGSKRKQSGVCPNGSIAV